MTKHHHGPRESVAVADVGDGGKLGDQAIGRSADQPTSRPADQPTSRPADQPTSRPADQPTRPAARAAPAAYASPCVSFRCFRCL
nr:PT domain-containing protein [Burkholderia sp. BCC1977]